MEWYFIILIAIIVYFLLGPIMLGFAKLNNVDPFILQRDNLKELLNTEKGVKSYIIVHIFGFLFSSLWIEKRLIDKIKNMGV